MCWIVQTVSVRDDPMGSMIQVMSMLFVPLSLTTPTRAWARHTGQSQMLFTLIGSAGHMTSPTGLGSTTSHTGYTDMETTTSSHAARRPILFPVIGPMPSHMGMVCNTAAATTGANTITKTIQISAAQIDAWKYKGYRCSSDGEQELSGVQERGQLQLAQCFPGGTRTRLGVSGQTPSLVPPHTSTSGHRK
jgi:hypothetical protein